MMNTDRKLPTYETVKRVRAARIAGVAHLDPLSGAGRTVLYLDLQDDGNHFPQAVSASYVALYKPQLGGYFIEFDGAHSYCPAHQFEEEYARVTKPRQLSPAQQAELDAQTELYAGATWDDDTLARLAALMKPQAAVVLRFNTIGNLSGVQVPAPREATPAELTTAALTGMLPPGTYRPEGGN